MMERAEASPYVDFPRTPSWYPPSVGGWAGAFAAAVGVVQRGHWLGLVAIAALIAVEFGFVRWYRRSHGALPTMQNPPVEFQPLFRRFAVGFVLVIATTMVLWLLAGPWIAAIVLAVFVTVAIAVYERAYAATAARVRSRLA